MSDPVSLPIPSGSADSAGTSARREEPRGQSLTIVIPALNEQEAIGGTIARCLEASAHIKEAAGLDDVEVVVVSDGSTDRTAEIAHGFAGVQVIEFEHNRGYGAAIKEGWRRGSGTLVGFLDADGTCDPRYFAQMCRVALDESADVVLGSRLGPDSKMPKVRRVGNRIYAFLLGALCGRQVTDTASGMRVVRRKSLGHLYPLPDGLHFTPSMSARALLNDLRVIEIPMPYQERLGRSKLSVVRDGVRFLRTIFAGVLCYRPERLLTFGFLLCAVLVVLMAAYPTEFYLQNRRLEDWMIYRFVGCQLLASVGLMLLLATALAGRVAYFGPRRKSANGFWPSVITALFSGRVLAAMTCVLSILSLGFLWPGIAQYVTTLHVQLHWSRLIAGAFTLLAAGQTAVFGLLIEVVSLWMHQQGEVQKESLSTTTNGAERNTNGKTSHLRRAA